MVEINYAAQLLRAHRPPQALWATRCVYVAAGIDVCIAMFCYTRSDMAFAAATALQLHGATVPELSSRRGSRVPTARGRSGAALRMVQSEVRSTEIESVNLDWENLGFKYRTTRCFVQVTWKDGAWGALETVTAPYLSLHVGATALHYGQSCFEGLKAFTQADGRIGVFRARDNAQRLSTSAQRLMIPEVPERLFVAAVDAAVRENAAYVPPYGTRGALYIRPLLFGSSARIGLQSAEEFTFLVLVTPVGDYYRGGLAPVTALLMDQHDRAAPRGVGHVKVAGNYAADLRPGATAKAQGYPINLYLDAMTRSYIEEFGTSNFFAFKGDTYVTPDSPSVLPSITNKTLMQLAKDNGMTVERRAVPLEELADFDAVGACGTAVIITAVSRIVCGEDTVVIGKTPDVVDERMKMLYEQVRAIQYGEAEDRHGWCHIVEI